jgi:hypothetical protein
MSKHLQNALKAFKEQMEGTDCPPCFSKEEYEVWVGLEELAPTVPVRRFVCRDCSIPHQKDMVKANKCFLRQWDSDIEGFTLIPVESVCD